VFCTTECWNCEDRNCEHYISKSKLYFENHQLKDRIEEALEYINGAYEMCCYTKSMMLDKDNIEELEKILKGEEKD